jgi:hypothetical protein
VSLLLHVEESLTDRVFDNSDTFDLINPILQYIPEQLAGEEDLRLVFSVHDGPMAQSDWSIMDMSKQLAEAGLGEFALPTIGPC